MVKRATGVRNPFVFAKATLAVDLLGWFVLHGCNILGSNILAFD